MYPVDIYYTSVMECSHCSTQTPIKMDCTELCGGVHTAPRQQCHWVLLQFIGLSIGVCVGVGQCERTMSIDRTVRWCLRLSKTRDLFGPYLPSATKLRRLCFYRCLSLHKGGGWCMVRGVPDPGGVPGLGGCLLPGVPGPGLSASGGVPGPRGVSPSRGVPGPGGVCSQGWYPSMHWGTHPPQGETATAADGTHPTGMHSCRMKKGPITNILVCAFVWYFIVHAITNAEFNANVNGSQNRN